MPRDLWAVPPAAQHDTSRLLADFDASAECGEVTCLYNSTNWWLEELVNASAELPEEAPGVEQRDWFL